MKHYEEVNGRLEVRGYADLFEKRSEKREISSAESADTMTGSKKLAKVCPRCGQGYTADQLRDVADYTGTGIDDVQCVDCDGVALVDVDDDQEDEIDRSGDKPDIS